MLIVFAAALALAQAPSGAAIFETSCAACHAGTDPRVPTVASLRQRTPESIVEALATVAITELARAGLTGKTRLRKREADGNGATVTISCAPAYGPKASATCNGFFEAIVTQKKGNIFSATFGQMDGSNAGLSSIKVAARAVAGTPNGYVA